MAVLPPRSVGALPKAFWHLMTSEHSPLKDFYPTDFEVDMDGKRYIWQGIVKLPFINEECLLLETKKLEAELKDDELLRNKQSRNKIFVISSHGLGVQIQSIPKTTKRLPIDARASHGMNGYILLCEEHSDLGNSTLYVKEMENIRDDIVICALYECPDWHPHNPRLHEYVTIPEKTITETDITEEPLWHEYEGFFPPYGLQRQRYENTWKTVNGEKLASSNSVSSKENFKGAGSGWLGRGKGCVVSLNSTKNAQSYRESKTCHRYTNGYTDTSSKKDSGSSGSFQSANAYKMVSSRPSMGRGSTRSTEANWKGNSYTISAMERTGFWPSKPTPTNRSTTVWQREDSASSGVGR